MIYGSHPLEVTPLSRFSSVSKNLSFFTSLCSFYVCVVLLAKFEPQIWQGNFEKNLSRDTSAPAPTGLADASPDVEKKCIIQESGIKFQSWERIPSFGVQHLIPSSIPPWKRSVWREQTRDQKKNMSIGISLSFCLWPLNSAVFLALCVKEELISES